VRLCQMTASEKNMQKADLSMEKQSGSTLQKDYHKLPNPGAVSSNLAGGTSLSFAVIRISQQIAAFTFITVSAENCHHTEPKLRGLSPHGLELRIGYPGTQKSTNRFRACGVNMPRSCQRYKGGIHRN
jgi:hypothetical protein